MAQTCFNLPREFMGRFQVFSLGLFEGMNSFMQKQVAKATAISSVLFRADLVGFLNIRTF